MSPDRSSETELLTGFARVARSHATTVRPTSPEEVASVFPLVEANGVIARGLGRSYGDAALNDGGYVVDSTRMARILDIDSESGTVRVEAGVSLARLLALLAPLGWTLPVLPATRHVTVGGAIAADVHGKNHHRVGSFAQHLERFILQTPTGAVEVDRASQADLFWATTGGMGLTGILVEATLRLATAPTMWVRASVRHGEALDEVLSQLDELASNHTYAIAWIDGLAGGARLGRGIAIGADIASLDALPLEARSRATTFRPRHWFTAPRTVPSMLLNDATVRIANSCWRWRSSLGAGTRLVPIDAVLMPLDAVPRWNHLYGGRGFVQYQFVVPSGEVAVLAIVIARLQRLHCASYFTTLKRLGAASHGLLSFPMPGWSLSLDIPARRPALARVLDDLDALVVHAGGRVYLAKDSRLRREHFRAMYPRIDQFRDVCERVDPSGLMQSDLSRRLGIR
jgi:decaprenylphospho-beta-D-ribofuranose 2-oxidase